MLARVLSSPYCMSPLTWSHNGIHSECRTKITQQNIWNCAHIFQCFNRKLVFRSNVLALFSWMNAIAMPFNCIAFVYFEFCHDFFLVFDYFIFGTSMQWTNSIVSKIETLQCYTYIYRSIYVYVYSVHSSSRESYKLFCPTQQHLPNIEITFAHPIAISMGIMTELDSRPKKMTESAKW